MDLIADLMIKEHSNLDKELEEFEKEPNQDKLDKFRWCLEKHFFIEEKAIFYIYQSIVGKEVENIFDVMKEHGEVLDLIKLIDNKLPEKDEENILKLKEILEKHLKFENSVFYPKLDIDLNPEQRKIIIEKVKEVVRV